jgi:hypothetical protein
LTRADLNSTALAFDAHEAQGNSAREREAMRIRLNEYALNLVERHFLGSARFAICAAFSSVPPLLR